MHRTGAARPLTAILDVGYRRDIYSRALFIGPNLEPLHAVSLDRSPGGQLAAVGNRRSLPRRKTNNDRLSKHAADAVDRRPAAFADELQ